MFGTGRRLGALEAQVAELKAQLAHMADLVELPELERMRTSVLNALRAYRRSVTAQDERTNHEQGSSQGDDIDRLLRLRRGS